MRSEGLLGEMRRWQVIEEAHIRPGYERDEVVQARGEQFPEQLQVEQDPRWYPSLLFRLSGLVEPRLSLVSFVHSSMFIMKEGSSTPVMQFMGYSERDAPLPKEGRSSGMKGKKSGR